MPIARGVAPLDEQQAEAADAATAMVVISNAATLAPPPSSQGDVLHKLPNRFGGGGGVHRGGSKTLCGVL